MLDSVQLEMKKNHKGVFSLQFFQPGNSTLPLDFTGVTSISLRARYGWSTATEIACELAGGDGIAISGGASNGTLVITISADKTASLPNLEIPLVFDLKYVPAAGGDPVHLVTGELKIHPSVF